MKMGAGTFWGIFLILIGIALILKVVFRIEIPIVKIVFALFFILIGLKILFGGFSYNKFKTNGNDVVFGEMQIQGDNFIHPEYNIVFGKGIFDLRNLNVENTGTKYVKIACVFGSTEIKLNSDLPVKITTESVFSGGKLPNGNTTAFGSSNYISPNYDPSKPHLNLKIEMVFSSTNITSY